MQIPLIGFLHAEDPQALAAFILDGEIIPRAVMSFPPLATNSLGPNGVEDAVDLIFEVQGNRPAIAVMRWGDHDTDFDGRGKQMEGADWRKGVGGGRKGLRD